MSSIAQRVVDLRLRILQKLELKWKKFSASPKYPDNLWTDPKLTKRVFTDSDSAQNAAYFLHDQLDLYVKWSDTQLKGIWIFLNSEISCSETDVMIRDWHLELWQLIVLPIMESFRWRRMQSSNELLSESIMDDYLNFIQTLIQNISQLLHRLQSRDGFRVPLSSDKSSAKVFWELWSNLADLCRYLLEISSASESRPVRVNRIHAIHRLAMYIQPNYAPTLFHYSLLPCNSIISSVYFIARSTLCKRPANIGEYLSLLLRPYLSQKTVSKNPQQHRVYNDSEINFSLVSTLFLRSVAPLWVRVDIETWSVTSWIHVFNRWMRSGESWNAVEESSMMDFYELFQLEDLTENSVLTVHLNSLSVDDREIAIPWGPYIGIIQLALLVDAHLKRHSSLIMSKILEWILLTARVSARFLIECDTLVVNESEFSWIGRQCWFLIILSCQICETLYETLEETYFHEAHWSPVKAILGDFLGDALTLSRKSKNDIDLSLYRQRLPEEEPLRGIYYLKDYYGPTAFGSVFPFSSDIGIWSQNAFWERQLHEEMNLKVPGFWREAYAFRIQTIVPKLSLKCTSWIRDDSVILSCSKDNIGEALENITKQLEDLAGNNLISAENPFELEHLPPLPTGPMYIKEMHQSDSILNEDIFDEEILLLYERRLELQKTLNALTDSQKQAVNAQQSQFNTIETLVQSQKVILVLDTNCYLHNIHWIKSLLGADTSDPVRYPVCIPMIVLTELKGLKNSAHIGKMADFALNLIYQAINRADLDKSIPIRVTTTDGSYHTRTFDQFESSIRSHRKSHQKGKHRDDGDEMSRLTADDMLLESCVRIQSKPPPFITNPVDIRVILITEDANLRNKARARNVLVLNVRDWRKRFSSQPLKK